MAALNVNSLVAHIDELRVFMSSSGIDILVINETKLNFLVDNNEVHLQGFEIIRKDRKTNGRNGGGVCIYVRTCSNLNYIIRDDLSSDNLECLIIEITNPHSKSFLVGTWYRPPDSLASKFIDFEDIIGKIDLENRELFLLGDINVDLLPEVESPNARKLKDIFDVYGLHQLILEATQVTPLSQTLIDLCITNSPLNIVKSGVVQLSISDHALVYTRKARYKRCGARIIEARCMKNFNESEFLGDLKQKAWNDGSHYSNPNDMWRAWKDCLMECINTHAPLRHIRAGRKKSPWITDNLRHKMRKRDLLKSKAASTNDFLSWERYKRARNHTNNDIRKAKRKYFNDNLDRNKQNPKATWTLINDLYSRKLDKLKRVPEIKIGEQTITNPTEIAKQFNFYFSNSGKDLATEIPPADVEPECYLKPSTQTFSLRIPTIGEVRNLLRKLNVRKATGLDKIPCKLLQLAADFVAPSLTKIYQRSIITVIFPSEWKLARVTPIFKKGKMNNPCNYRPISVIPTVAKIFEKIVYDQLYNYLNENNLLTSCQSGFGHFTAHSLH